MLIIIDQLAFFLLYQKILKEFYAIVSIHILIEKLFLQVTVWV